jgi:hypothetical protein
LTLKEKYQQFIANERHLDLPLTTFQLENILNKNTYCMSDAGPKLFVLVPAPAANFKKICLVL